MYSLFFFFFSTPSSEHVRAACTEKTNDRCIDVLCCDLAKEE